MASTSINRALGQMETFMQGFFDYETSMTIVYSLNISTKSALTDTAMVSALTSWAQIFPMLRLQVVEREGVLRFKEIDDLKIDFERMQGDWVERYDELLNKKFNKDGPLWRVRLVEQSDSQTGGDWPFSYVLLLNWFHVITDGTSNIRMCNRLMEVLSATQSGTSVQYASEVEIKPPIEGLLPHREYLWTEVKPLLAEMMKMFSDQSGTAWGKTNPGQIERENQTRVILEDVATFDKETTARFIQRCKAEGLTVNGALNVASNIAIYNQLKLDGETGDKLTVEHWNSVNLRRFMEDKDVCGFTVGFAECQFEVDSTTADRFWEQAKEASKTLHAMFADEAFFIRLLAGFSDLFGGSAGWLASQQEATATICDCASSNLADVSKMFPGEYEHVIVDYISRSSSLAMMGMPFFLNATTFRGRLLLSADCVTRFCTKEKGQAILKDIVDILKTALNK